MIFSIATVPVNPSGERKLTRDQVWAGLVLKARDARLFLRTRDIPLNWDVFVTPGIPMVTSDLPPGTKQGMWSPISSTLIYGRRDAVLVDAFITVEQADALVDWVEAS